MSLEGKSPEDIAALAALADDLLNKPEYSRDFQKLIKKANPNVSMPFVEIEQRVQEELAPIKKDLEQHRKDKELDAAERAVNAVYESLRDAGLVATKADFAALVKYASEKGFMTSENGLRMAAQHRANEQESAEPTPPFGGAPGFELGQGELGKAFMKDPAGTARTEAAKAMDELRRQAGKGHRTH